MVIKKGQKNMAKTASVFTRVDPMINEQAEEVLNELGMSMATAMEVYLRQIALLKKIPFEIKLPNESQLIHYQDLSDEEFDQLMNQAFISYQKGECVDFDSFRKSFIKDNIK